MMLGAPIVSEDERPLPLPPSRRPLGMRARISYALGSLFVVAFVLGLLIAAGPGSYTMGKVYPVVQPALGAVNIDNDWGFFAPDPGPGSVARYVVRDRDGRTHEFGMTEAMPRWSLAYFRYTTLYMAIAQSPEYYLPGAVAYLCRQHADLDPVSITVILADQQDVTAQEFLEGKDPMADLEISKVGPRRCDAPLGEDDKEDGEDESESESEVEVGEDEEDEAS